MSSSKKFCFSFNDQLPTEFQCVENILWHAPGGRPQERFETTLRKQVIHCYASDVRKIWDMAFTGFVISIIAIKTRIRRLLEDHYKTVKPSGKLPKLSQITASRKKRSEWRHSHNVLLDLLVAGTDTTSFCVLEKIFYNDQKGCRMLSISEDIVVCAEGRAEIIQQLSATIASVDYTSPDTLADSPSTTRSGLPIHSENSSENESFLE